MRSHPFVADFRARVVSNNYQQRFDKPNFSRRKTNVNDHRAGGASMIDHAQHGISDEFVAGVVQVDAVSGQDASVLVIGIVFLEVLLK